MTNTTKKQQSQLQNENKELDFSSQFIVHGRYPIYVIEHLKQVIDDTKMTVEKIPMGVDGAIVWTYFKITIKPHQWLEPYTNETDIKMTVLEGQAGMMIKHKSQNAHDILQPGDIIIIPANATYSIANMSKDEPFIFTIDANSFLEIN